MLEYHYPSPCVASSCPSAVRVDGLYVGKPRAACLGTDRKTRRVGDAVGAASHASRFLEKARVPGRPVTAFYSRTHVLTYCTHVTCAAYGTVIVNVTGVSPAAVAVTVMVCAAAVGVTVTDVCPFTSVVVEVALKVPVPVIVHVTGTFSTPSPWAVATMTTSGADVAPSATV